MDSPDYLGTGKNTCIDCHKGIAHHLPDMKGIPQG
ncbi:MAG TPA: NapC/NirT family cytochrome c [Sphingopyxis sp.]|nr:NapC/NirT family cytochrome c [Sphingopyxis sp.]HWW57770.1 NapC/NirT family cytochrome c [Sphingopyxis sp.]